MPFDSFSIGTIRIDTSISLSGYRKDKKKLIEDAKKTADRLSRSINIKPHISLGQYRKDKKKLTEDIQKYAERLSRRANIKPKLSLTEYRKSKKELVGEAEKTAQKISGIFSKTISGGFRGAGKELADSVSRDFPRQGLQIQNSLGSTITGAILKANIVSALAGQIVGGVVRAGSMITQPLQNIVSAISGSISEGLSFQNASRIRTEILSVSSALSGVANISFDDAQTSIEGLNERLAESAAALPGTTDGFLRIARGISDEIARASRNAETGLFDAQRWEDTTARLSELAGVLDAASINNIGLTTMGLSRALGGESVASLRQLQLFQDNPTLLSGIESQLATIGAESLRDVTIEGRALILERALETVVTPELLDRASESADGLIQAFLSRLGDPTTGIFSISRELASSGQSVFDSLTESLRLLIGEGTGLFDRLIESARSAGLSLGDPMEALQGAIIRVNETISHLAENTDAFFQSDVGETLVEIVTTIQERVPQAFGFLVRLGEQIIPVAINGLERLSQIAGSALNEIAASIPDLSGLSFGFELDTPNLSGVSTAVEAISNAFALARDYAQSFFGAFASNVDLSGFFEAGRAAIEGVSESIAATSRSISNFVSSNQRTIAGVGETLGAIFGEAISTIGDLTATVSRTFIPVLQRGGELLGGVFGEIWDGLRPVREWFASDETRVFLSNAIDGLGRIASFLVDRIGVHIAKVLELLDLIFIKSGLIERTFNEIGRVIQLVATGIGGILNLVSRWEEITSAVSGAFSAIVEVIRLRLRDALMSVINLVSDRFGPQIELVGGIFESIVETVRSIWEWLDRTFGISERLAGPLRVVKEVAEGIVETISNMFGGLQRIIGLGGRGQARGPAQPFAPGGGGFASPLQGQNLQDVVSYQQTAGQDFDAYRAYRQGYHAGIDFDSRIGGGEGGIVQSVTDGVVTEINELFSNAEGAGGSVQVRIETTDSSGQTVQQRYTHLSRQAVQEAGLQVGQQVRAGQVIGAVGSTDTVSSGAHLDYKVTVNGQFVNPDEFLSLAGAAGQLTTLDIRSGRQGQVNIGAIAGQGRAPGIGGGLTSSLSQASGALSGAIDPVYSGLLQRFQGDSTVASAFYGNFVQESGLDTTAVNQIGASGLAQWLGSRKDELQSFADQMGKEWTDLDVQLDFVLHELETSESSAWQKIREVAATGDVAATTTAVRRYYERPGEHEANDARRIAEAQRIAREGGAAPVAAATPVIDSQFLDPTQRAARELAEAERILGREAQLRAQFRQEEDRAISLQREQQQDELRAQQAELAPTDTAGAAIINAQLSMMQTADSISDRILRNEREITDLTDAREKQRLQRINLEAQRGAFERAIETGGTATTTEEELRKLEAEISPVDFSAAIANLEEYGEALEAQLADKLRPIQASLSQFADRAVEDSRTLLRSVEQLNRQYGDPSPYLDHQTAVDGINLAYEENGKKLDQTITQLEQLSGLENLSEEQYAALANRLDQATTARDNLTAAQERAIEIANESYESQQRLATINLAEQLMAPQLRAAEAEAQSIERFDQFGANVIRRQAAIAQMGTRFATEVENMNQQFSQLTRQFEQAQAIGDQGTLDRLGSLGIGSTEDIQALAEQSQASLQQVYATEFQALRDQFPTVADAFRSNLRDATSQGLTQGIRGLASGEMNIGEAFGNLFMGIADTVISTGAQRISDLLTGGLFGNGEGGGLLGGILGANEDSIPGQAEQASSILDQGGLIVGQRMIEGAQAAANILAGAGPSLLSGGGFGDFGLGDGGFDLGGLDLGGFNLGRLGGGPETLDVGSFGRATLPNLFGGGEGEGLGTTIAEGFKASMPEAGSLIAGGRGQGQGFIGSLIQGVGGLFGGGGLGGSSGGGGGGGGNILGTLFGIASSFFSSGGYIGNLAGGGIAAAMSRERLASGKNPRLAVVNDNEYVFSSGAVDRIGVHKLDAMNFGGYVPNFAMGGIAQSLPTEVPDHGQYMVPIETNTRPSKVEYKFQSEVINQREYVSKDQLDLLEQRVNAAPQQGAQFAIEALRSSPSARNRAGF